MNRAKLNQLLTMAVEVKFSDLVSDVGRQPMWGFSNKSLNIRSDELERQDIEFIASILLRNQVDDLKSIKSIETIY